MARSVPHVLEMALIEATGVQQLEAFAVRPVKFWEIVAPSESVTKRRNSTNAIGYADATLLFLGGK